VIKIDISRIHTTPLGIQRIKKNLNLAVDDVVAWCKEEIAKASSESIVQKGKNYYVHGSWYVLTINMSSHGIITAHKKK